MRVLEMLFHVVYAGELLGAAAEGTFEAFPGDVDLGVARGMARGREGLFAADIVVVAAVVALGA